MPEGDNEAKARAEFGGVTTVALGRLDITMARWGFLDSEADPDLVVERRSDLAEAIATVFETDSHQARAMAIEAILHGAQLNAIRESQKTAPEAQAQEPSLVADRG